MYSEYFYYFWQSLKPLPELFLILKCHHFFPVWCFRSMKNLFTVYFIFEGFCISSLLWVIVLTLSHNKHVTVTPAIFIQKPQGTWRVSAAFDLDLSLTFSFSSLIQFWQQLYLCKEKGVWHLGTGCQESETVDREALLQNPPVRGLTCE